MRHGRDPARRRLLPPHPRRRPPLPWDGQPTRTRPDRRPRHRRHPRRHRRRGGTRRPPRRPGPAPPRPATARHPHPARADAAAARATGQCRQGHAVAHRERVAPVHGHGAEAARLDRRCRMIRRPKHIRRRPVDPMAVGLTLAIIFGSTLGVVAGARSVTEPEPSRALRAAPPTTIAGPPARSVGTVRTPPPAIPPQKLVSWAPTNPTVQPSTTPAPVTSADTTSTTTTTPATAPPAITVPLSTTTAATAPPTTAPTSTTRPGRRHGHTPATAISSGEAGP